MLDLLSSAIDFNSMIQATRHESLIYSIIGLGAVLVGLAIVQVGVRKVQDILFERRFNRLREWETHPFGCSCRSCSRA